MQISAPSPNQFANLVAPFSPIGKPAQPLEEPIESPFAPVTETEETSASQTEVRNLNEEERANQGREQDQIRQQREAEQRRQAEVQRQQELQDRQQLQRLAERDREVRAHEAAHAAVGGQLAGAPRFEFTRGPNGQLFATGGEVSISLPSGDNPEQVLRQAEQVRRAALAPAEPSRQDRAVAAQATQIAQQARVDIREQQEAEVAAAEQAREVRQTERAEEEKQIEAAEEERREMQRAAEEQDQLNAQERLAQITGQTSDLNRRLNELGVIPDEKPTGGLLDFLA